MAHLFTVWNKTRDKKVFVIIPEGQNLLERLILKASEKLDVNGASLVLESNGTPVDEDEILLLLKPEILILLDNNESWIPAENQSTIDGSTATTLTVNSSHFSESQSFEISSDDADVQMTPQVLSTIPIIIDANMEYTWTHMEIPWEKIPSNLLKAFEEGLKWQDCKSTITEVCHIIVHEMRNIKSKIPVMAFKSISQKIVNKYPKTFQELDADGIVIGDGTYFLVRKLIDRNNYLNRPHKRGFQGTNTPLKFRKQKVNVAGCVNWEETSPVNENKCDQEKLKNINEKDKEYYELLEKTYSDQRAYLNDIETQPSIHDIRENWPVLFQKAAIIWHFRKLTGVDLENIKTSIEEKAPKIIQYGIEKKTIGLDDLDPNKKVENVLQLYAKLFKEDLSKFFIVHAKDTNQEKFENIDDHAKNDDNAKKKIDINKNVDLQKLISINAPCVVETNTQAGKFYKVFIEKQEVYEDATFIDSFMVCFGLYFVLNLQYPKAIAITLEMVQRFHLKIHPDSGTKAKTASKGKVLTLMKNLSKVFS